jgi:threonine dehydrogenase-like Zn-dependent dehydrogenase
MSAVLSGTTTCHLMLVGPNEIAWQERERPEPGELQPHEVLIRSDLSAIKHGTEKVYVQGDGPFQDHEFDQVPRLFVPRTRPLFPMTLGNMTAGTVIACGSAVTSHRPGDRVFGWLSIGDYHVCAADRVMALGGLTPRQAVCVDPAIFAHGAIHDARMDLAGKVALVTGLGAIGLLVGQLLHRAGATVYAASAFPLRRALAACYGADHVIDTRHTPDLGAIVREMTGGGADIVFECSGRYPTLHQAIRATRLLGTVITVGFYPGDGRGLYLGREYFHNLVSLVPSLPAFRFKNPTRDGLCYADLQAEAVDSIGTGRLSVEGLLHPVLPFDQADDAFRLFAEHPEQVIKCAITYLEE